SVLELGNFTFPPGDYSATDGNPCGVRCLPIEYGDCLAVYGCLYNCLEISYVDEIACGKGGTCEQVTRTVKNPFATST
ncbi:hypothetical protein MPER_07826, partial [Moniliophthora perniciosa FA553]